MTHATWYVPAVLKKIYQFILDIVCPPICFSCRGAMHQHDILCLTCQQELETITPKLFDLGSRYILTVYPVSRYTQPLRPLLFAKYRSDQLVIEKLAELIWQHSALRHIQVDYLVPIPLHWSRMMQRGFNQSSVIANSLSALSGIPVSNMLQRVKATQYQVRVEHADRVLNVKDAFECVVDKEMIEGKHIMLVDDSCTTGATAIQAAKKLVKYKPAAVSMIVACRAL